MPTVPSEFVPRVGETPTNTPPVSAPFVQPMQNYAPQQIERMSESISRAGATVTQIGNRIQDEMDDANVKAAETKFITQATDILHGQNGYLTKQGADAINEYDGAQQALLKAKKDAFESLGNDVQKGMFDRVSQVHLATFGAQMGEHRSVERNRYTATESMARANSMAVLHSQDEVGSKAQAVHEAIGVKAVQDALRVAGIPDDSEQSKQKVRAYRTGLVAGNVNRLMVDSKYGDAKSYLSEQVKAGNVEPEVGERLRNAIESNLERVELLNKADEIFAPYQKKQLRADDLDAMLKKAETITDPEKRKQVEGLLKGKFSDQHSLQQQQYRDNLNDVVNYKYGHNGSLKGVDPAKWAMLDAKDKYDLTRPVAQESNLNVWYLLTTKPDMLTVDNVRKFYMSGFLSESDFKGFTERAMSAEKQADWVQDANAVNLRIDHFADRSGIKVYGALSDEEKKRLGLLKFRIADEIGRVKALNHGKATAEQVDEIIKQNVRDNTLLTLRSWGNWFGGSDYATESTKLFEVPEDYTEQWTVGPNGQPMRVFTQRNANKGTAYTGENE